MGGFAHLVAMFTTVENLNWSRINLEATLQFVYEWRPQALFIVGHVEVLVWDKSFIFYLAYPLPQRLNKTFKKKHAMVNHKYDSQIYEIKRYNSEINIDRFIKKKKKHPEMYIFFMS